MCSISEMSTRENEEQLSMMNPDDIKQEIHEGRRYSRRRPIVISSDSDSEYTPRIIKIKSLNTVSPEPTPMENISTREVTPELQADTELNLEIRRALGDPVEEASPYGQDIHAQLVSRWLPILLNGLTEDVKEKLLDEHKVPKNCRLLKAPIMNSEIGKAVCKNVQSGDQELERRQNKLGLAITAISKALSLLLDSSKQNVDIIKHLSDGCRILLDLHFEDTQTRTKLITPCLDNSLLNIIKDEKRDDTLFGTRLSEKILSANVKIVSCRKHRSEAGTFIRPSKPAAKIGGRRETVDYTTTSSQIQPATRLSARQQRLNSAPISAGDLIVPSTSESVPTTRNNKNKALAKSAHDAGYPGDREFLHLTLSRRYNSSKDIDDKINSIVTPTFNRYCCTYRSFWYFCHNNNIRYLQDPHAAVKLFLTELSKNDITFHVIKNHRSALSFLFGKIIRISDFRKIRKNLKTAFYR